MSKDRHFNQRVWTDRATRRRENAIHLGRDSESIATLKWLEEIRFIESLGRTIAWCTGQGIAVEFTKREGGLWEDGPPRRISITASARPLTQLCILLHEIGHYVIDTSHPKYTNRYSMGWAACDDNRLKRTDKHRLTVLEEEYEAWFKGWGIALMVGALTEFDRDKYDDMKVQYLKTYVKWAARGEGYTRYTNDA